MASWRHVPASGGRAGSSASSSPVRPTTRHGTSGVSLPASSVTRAPSWRIGPVVGDVTSRVIGSRRRRCSGLARTYPESPGSRLASRIHTTFTRDSPESQACRSLSRFAGRDCARAHRDRVPLAAVRPSGSGTTAVGRDQAHGAAAGMTKTRSGAVDGTSDRPARRAGGIRSVRGRTRLAGIAVAASASAALIWSATGNAAVTAPHFINVFPSRDFVHIEGYEPGAQVKVTVRHDPTAITSLTNAGQDASATGTVGSDGIFEVNHPGGACWTGFTPDIRPGDTVSVSDPAAPAGTPPLDSMVVQNVSGGRPIQTAPDTIVVHGTAANADGSRPNVAILGSRLISPTRFFANGGKRNLNAPAVTYDDATGHAWTATYQGLGPDDMTTALEADTSAAWVVTAPTGATPLEQTSQETGANAIAGPTTGCTSRLEKVQVTGSETVPPSTPANVAASLQGANTVHLTWDASTDPISTPAASGVQTYEVRRDAHDGKGPIAVATVQNADGSNNPPATY